MAAKIQNNNGKSIFVFVFCGILFLFFVAFRFCFLWHFVFVFCGVPASKFYSKTANDMTSTLWGKTCPIEGHAFLSNKKARNPACPSLRRCKQYQDGNDGSVKTFRELSIKASTNVVNETDNRLLKSGKDTRYT